MARGLRVGGFLEDEARRARDDGAQFILGQRAGLRQPLAFGSLLTLRQGRIWFQHEGGAVVVLPKYVWMRCSKSVFGESTPICWAAPRAMGAKGSPSFNQVVSARSRMRDRVETTGVFPAKAFDHVGQRNVVSGVDTAVHKLVKCVEDEGLDLAASSCGCFQTRGEVTTECHI